ncbi:MAG: hypothetical protein HOQ05_02335 [Corynebacteriales bacterium]|nr:hypothetical protein [Mycobacteriales bacterium]
MSAMLVPIGHAVGPLYPLTGTPEADNYEIRIGDGIFNVDAEELRIWSLIHGDPKKVVSEMPSRKMMYEAAGDLPISQINMLIDRLRDFGLIMEFTPGGQAARAFGYQHKVNPLAVGLGNTEQAPWYFSIGLPNAARVIVAHGVYHLWMFGHRHASLWEACLYLASERKALARADLESDPDRLLAQFLDALPALVATACVYVDRVR